MESHETSLVLCMEKPSGKEVALNIDPNDTFQIFLDKARALLGYDVDLNCITKNQSVSVTDNIYEFLLKAEKNNNTYYDFTISNYGQSVPKFYAMKDHNDVAYILDDGTEINASQIHFDNEDPLVDITAEKIPFVKYNDIETEDTDLNNINEEHIKTINIVGSPISHWSNDASSPKSSFANTLPFKLICGNPSGFEGQYAKYLETNVPKTYATLNPVTTKNKSPRTLIIDNFKKCNDHNVEEYTSFTREDILNMFKDPPIETVFFKEKRRHVKKSDPSRPNSFGTYIDYEKAIDQNVQQMCFICTKSLDHIVNQIYFLDKKNQKTVSSISSQKANFKMICEQCLEQNFKHNVLKPANEPLNHNEFVIIKNNKQSIFEKKTSIHLQDKNRFTNLGEAKAIIDKIESQIKTKESKFLKLEIGSDGEIITKPVENEHSDNDVTIVNDTKGGNSSDIEIIESPTDEHVIYNLDEADEQVKEFLGKGQCLDEPQDLKCRFCDCVFSNVEEVSEHAGLHKHVFEDGNVFPCPLCDYGYSVFTWLKGHLKAAHGKVEEQVTSKNVVLSKVNESGKDSHGQVAKSIENGSGTMDLELTIKMEVKEEETSDDDIWIVHTDDKDASEQLQKILHVPKPNGKEEIQYKKVHKCANCSQVYVEDEKEHECKGRDRTQKGGAANSTDNVITPNAAVYIKRAQRRRRTIDGLESDLSTRKTQRNCEPTSDPVIVTCHNCSESFTSKVRLKFHMQFHESNSMLSDDGRYTCPDCEDVKCGTETELFDHVHFQHDKQSKWQCPVKACGKTFFLKATLTKHSRTHTDTRRYVCNTCNKRFLDKQTLDEHGVTHLQVKPYQCHICMKQLTRRSRLRMHLRAHEEELSLSRVLVCAFCQRAFRDLADAQEHVSKFKACVEHFTVDPKQRNETRVQLSPTSGLVRYTVQVIEPPSSKPIPYEVPKDQAQDMLEGLSGAAQSIIRVVEIEKAFRCEYCEDVFYTEDSLNSHRAMHKGVKNPFTCHICKVSFTTYSRCTTHKTTHGFYKRSLADAKKHAQMSPQSKEEAGPSSTGILGYGGFPVVKHFLCEDCGRSYLHWTYLQVHRRMKHANENFLFKCNSCGLTFPNSWSVAYHRKKIHSNASQNDPGSTKIIREHNRISCRDCEEFLPNKTALYKHRKNKHSDLGISSNPGPFGCQYCNKRFTSRQVCEDHALHCNNKENKSDMFYMINSLQIGQNTILNQNSTSWICQFCQKKFRLRSELRSHLRTKHSQTLTVIEVGGLNTSPSEVAECLAAKNIRQDNILEVTKMSFAKGVASLIPSSARALSMLSRTPQTKVSWTTPVHARLANSFEVVSQPRITTKNPRLPNILQRSSFSIDHHQQSRGPTSSINVDSQELNIYSLLGDQTIIDGTQMV